MKSTPISLPEEKQGHSKHLLMSAKLYGRDQNIQTLLDAFDQVCRGAGKVQLVSGNSGVGKSSLVQEVRIPVRRSNGFFLEGKFNQYQQDVPYFALRQALSGLCRELLRDDEVQRQHWKTALLKAVGTFGQLLVDLVPELESLIGKQAPVADISPLEARHRLGGLFREFLKVFCRPEHPVVLFIDDWQWADAATLDLLTKLEVDTTLRYLLVIVCYRDNEVDSFHPLVAAVEELKQQNVPVDKLDVHNLAQQEVVVLLSDTLKPNAENLDGLAALVHRLTQGNPFFTRTLIQFLYDQALLRFAPSKGGWIWSAHEIGASQLPADVVELFARKLSQLLPASRTLLSLAACLGNRFDLETLAIVSDRSVEQCRHMLHEEAIQGLLVPIDGESLPSGFNFLHDRVQQAAYGFIQPLALAEVRLELGRRLLEKLEPEQLNERIFQVADHLNAGELLIQDLEEQIGVVALNVQAAQKARTATAYRTALRFQRAAARFLDRPGFADHLWKNHHELAMKLFLAWAEGEFLEGDRNQSELCVRMAVDHAVSSIEKADALNALIVYFTLLARYPEAIAAGREALAVLGISLPEADFDGARDREIEQVRLELKTRPVAELFNMQVMSHPEMRTAAKILITMGPPCYRSHQRLWSVIVPMVVNLTLRYGNIPQIGYSHTAFGGLLGWVNNDYATAKEFGALATELMTRTFDAPVDQSVFYLMIGSSLRHWFEPLKSGSRDYALAYETGLRSGNLQYAAYAFGHNMYCRFYQGTSLPQLIQESQHSLEFSRTRLNQWAIDLLEGGLRIFGALSGSALVADDDEAWETDYLRRVDEHHNIQVKCIYSELRAVSLLMLGQFERALEWSDKVEPLIYTVGTQGLLPWPEHVFSRALMMSALYADAPPERKEIWHVEIERTLAQLSIWAASCPDNFAHKHALVAAELARLDGQVFAALRLYHQAAASAAAGAFTQWEGMAHERAATLLESCCQGRMAGVYWQHAYRCFDRLGASAKLLAMETTCRDTLSRDIQEAAKAGVKGDVPDPDLFSELLDKQLYQLRSHSAEQDASSLQSDFLRTSRELAEGAEHLRVEIAERKRAEEQLKQYREQLEETILQRTAQLEANQKQLSDARTAALNLMEDAIAARDQSEAAQETLKQEMIERKQYEQQLRIAATAFESQEGMSITDAAGTILRVNHAFTKITGYSAEEVVGKNPRMLKSGRHDADFYAAMWKVIHSTGAWEGEIWNRRKNGELFPEHLTITAVKNDAGVVSNYVATLTDITLTKAAEDEIKHLAFFDPLTRLPNRRLLQDRLQQSITAIGRSARSGALLFIDLDNFKTLNDTLGHDVGDLLLKQVALRLESCVREGDTVARLGGDEFVIVLEDLSKDAQEAAARTRLVGDKILDVLNQPYQLVGHEYRNTPSIGVALFNDHAMTVDALMKQADIAMYQSKNTGRNTLSFFDPHMQEAVNARANLEAELRKALELQQFQLHYQIQVDGIQANGSHRALGAEALIRWLHPERGLVSPAQFIPLAEETGVILPIGQWVLETACAQLKHWQQAALTRELVLSVNVSARQFRQAEFVAQVDAVIKRHAINPQLLKLELTESLLLEDIEDTITTMNALNEMGIMFSLDDFGTGYSSLQYLKRLPLDQLKIDQSFVRDINADSSDRAIVRTIIVMAHSLNLSVIAEGVETEQQRQILLNKGCTHFQGYLFGKPVPIEQFEAQLM